MNSLKRRRWESNPPEELLTLHNGFEDREAHQQPIYLQIQTHTYAYYHKSIRMSRIEIIQFYNKTLILNLLQQYPEFSGSNMKIAAGTGFQDLLANISCFF